MLSTRVADVVHACFLGVRWAPQMIAWVCTAAFGSPVVTHHHGHDCHSHAQLAALAIFIPVASPQPWMNRSARDATRAILREARHIDFMAGYIYAVTNQPLERISQLEPMLKSMHDAALNTQTQAHSLTKQLEEDATADHGNDAEDQAVAGGNGASGSDSGPTTCPTTPTPTPPFSPKGRIITVPDSPDNSDQLNTAVVSPWTPNKVVCPWIPTGFPWTPTGSDNGHAGDTAESEFMDMDEERMVEFLHAAWRLWKATRPTRKRPSTEHGSPPPRPSQAPR